ncbi:aspartate kinase [Helicobacter enhydrae]|uniref:Aspartokinase n=1 Tax=Helicobacter enhydrae TaxID=222136 RepID=A0A1B1U713_9HELI|nr:aspartate kinase [Helicobacter enhydrae]ANV98530.1 aspartate kinase [Helicobacter enhydrae]
MLIVQKYGGTSVGNCERINNITQKIIKAKKAGHQVVVVVSAMSGDTDKLVQFIQYFQHTDYPIPNPRESDVVLSSGEQITRALVAIALESQGYKAISLSGKEAGIITDGIHTKARIEQIQTDKIINLLQEDYIVIVAGFQGATTKGATTTLGRGGSDLSAVAIAGAIQADVCEIYTDVDGVYTTDPRIEPQAKKLDKISYEEMLELASMGAKVLLNRSVEMAKKLNVNLITRNSFNDNEGTLITSEENIMEQPIVSGVALDKNQARISISNLNDEPGIAAKIFESLSAHNINVDMIVQTIGRDGKTDLDFTIPKTEIALTQQILKDFSHLYDQIDCDYNIAKVSIVGVGMKSHSGVASSCFSAMAKENINIMMIGTSEIKISMIISDEYAQTAVRALHKTYNLDR